MHNVENFERFLQTFSAQTKAVRRPGRGKATWSDTLRFDLVRLVNTGLNITGLTLKKKNALDDLLDIVIDKTFYGQWPRKTLRRVFYDSQDVPGKFGPQLELLQQWGRLARPPLSPEEARELFAQVFAAAGSDALAGQSPRQARFGELFEIAGRKYGVTDHEKIEWFRWLIPNLLAHPLWWPRERPEIRDSTRRDKILKLINEAPGKRGDLDYLCKKTGWTYEAVKNLTRRLEGDDEIVRIAPGVFTLPGLGTAHVPAREEVLAVFEANPGTEYKAVDFVKMLGRTRQAIDSAFHGHGALVRDGKIIPVRRGVFVLAPKAR